MKQKKMITILGISTALMVVIRSFVLLFFFDPATGFVKNGMPALFASGAFWLLFVISALAIFILTAFMSRRKPAGNAKLKDYKPLRIFTIVMCVCCLLSGLPIAFEAISAWNLIGLAVCLLSAVFFLLEVIKDEMKIKSPLIFTIMPSLMFVYFAVRGFISLTGITLITENVLFIFSCCLGILFFVTEGKVLSEIKFRTNSAHLLPIGFLFFLFGVTYSLPPILFGMMGKASLVHGGVTATHFIILVSCVYALCFTLTLFSKKLLLRHKKTTEKLDFSTPETSTDFYH